jgi:hypothetical protein
MVNQVRELKSAGCFSRFSKEKKMKKIIQTVVIMLMLALFIGACLPATPVQQNLQVQNTQSLDTQSQIDTAVAQTIEAQNQIGTAVALTTEAQFTPTFTATPLTIPTLTPFIISTPTNKPSGSGNGVPAKADYSCDIIRLRPTAYAEFTRGQSFDIKMTIVNNGARAWYQGFDYKYSGGAQMTTTTFVELPAMEPGDQYEVVLDAVAPAERGNQTMTWMVQGQLCFGYVVITVK